MISTACCSAEYRHARLRPGVTACSIDSSDGNTSDAVYKYVRTRRGRGVEHVMAIKGAKNPDAEIFRKPGPVIDTNRKNTKAARFGVAVTWSALAGQKIF